MTKYFIPILEAVASLPISSVFISDGLRHICLGNTCEIDSGESKSRSLGRTIPAELIEQVQTKQNDELVISIKIKHAEKCLHHSACLAPTACLYLVDGYKHECPLEGTFAQVEIKNAKEGLRNFALTSREEEILRVLLRGYSQKKIANVVGISAYTVNDHLKSIYKKIGVNSKGEALFKARGWMLD